MILRPFRRSAENHTIAALYGAIVAQARSAVFYADFAVPDTMQGRFDLIVLHLVLLLNRVECGSDAARRLGQRLFDAFCRDLDGNLREMGIGDLAVPKHMRRFGEAFYGRQEAYLTALAAADAQAFEKAIARNIFPGAGSENEAVRLARYARAAVCDLAVQEEDTIARGAVTFPNPEAFAHARA